MPSPQGPLVCKACDYANEKERIYCHNCGAKLDRSALIPMLQAEEELAQKKHREVKKIMSAGRGNFARPWKKLFKTLALAALVGAGIDAVLPPEGVTLATKDGQAMEAPSIDSLLENLVAHPTSHPVPLSEADVNAYLRKERFKKLPAWLTADLPLRAHVRFEPNVATFQLVANAAGHPLCVTFSGNLKIEKPTGIVAACTGGSIGRLPIPAQLAGYAGEAALMLMDSMKNERRMLGQIGSIEIGAKQIILRGVKPSDPAALATPDAGVKPSAPIAPSGSPAPH
jgi:hypothetical protein